ncbi:unnamed protein product [Rotaria sp. Silwood2]|nr:unnamed protein product [Rotaria sp. Silwood2]CAF4176661.1 unnamed protein product [Rotaria sp. Silwood2]CAF4365860.1 unnamed protein product [Rotaria sp. Silwood2]
MRANTKYKEVLDQKIGTNVVSDILYGVDIFLVFNRKLSGNENRKEIQNLNNNEKKFAETLTCQYYGDIQFGSNSTTSKEAVKLLYQMSKLLENYKQNTKQKQIALYIKFAKDNLNSKTIELIIDERFTNEFQM